MATIMFNTVAMLSTNFMFNWGAFFTSRGVGADQQCLGLLLCVVRYQEFLHRCPLQGAILLFISVDYIYIYIWMHLNLDLDSAFELMIDVMKLFKRKLSNVS
jgi:hypothetical protein